MGFYGHQDTKELKHQLGNIYQIRDVRAIFIKVVILASCLLLAFAYPMLLLWVVSFFLPFPYQGNVERTCCDLDKRS